MRLITVVLVLINVASFNFYSFAQEDYTGYIVTLNQEKIIGTIRGDKNLFSEVKFVGLDGKMTKYTPNDIKGFSIKYPQQRIPIYYESMSLENIGNVFAQRRFSDGKIKNYYTEYGDIIKYSFYTVADTIFQLNTSNLPSLSHEIVYDNWLNGGLILASKDTLRGELFFPNPNLLGLTKNVKFRINQSTDEIKTYKLDELRGYFSDEFSYLNLNNDESDTKGKKREIYVLFRNGPMQLVGEEKRINTAGQYTSLVQFYYLKNQKSDEILRILDKRTSPTLPKKYIEKVSQWFKDYPALAEAIISRNLTDEGTIANLYNIHYAINNTNK